jgi:4'-phosphopantetheinyl transferase
MRELPAAGEVHVWLRGPEKEGVREVASEAGASNRRSQEDLINVLADYTGMPPGKLTFQRGEMGKPWLAGGPCFNLSHSAGATAIAVSRQEVGIDIEHPKREVSVAGLASKFFDESECRLLASLPEPDQSREFLKHWVRKEAMTKLGGEGIFRALRFARVVSGEEGHYRGKRVALHPVATEVGMLGALAVWEPVRVKVFVIPPKSASIA